ncbi:hypothetical protein FRC19_003889 [Serendipita sp. 401]|nr:hypothetical protein FRC15_009660 [Serendipita sp. 397]KAG8828550.1 hypothetical protein FRC19_003889 [Serendipita sp. 401]KAG9058580.1 hypothetical protein FS842_008002 [Serendipita sp. 407]
MSVTTTTPRYSPPRKVADEVRILGSINDEGVIQLSDGTLRCKHGLEVCATCPADYRFMREILDDGGELQWMDDDDFDYDDEYDDEATGDIEMKEWRAQCEICGEPAQLACDACKQLLYCNAEHRETNKQKHASECPERPKTIISTGLLLSDSNELPDSTILTTNPILSSVNHNLDLSNSSDIQTVLDSITASKPPSAILLVNLIRPSKHSELLPSLYTYIKDSGGTVILALGYGKQGASVTQSELDETLAALGVSWKAGSVESNLFNMNEMIARGINSTNASASGSGGSGDESPLAELLRRSTLFLPRSFRVEALQLKGIRKNEAVYLSTESANVAGDGEIQSPTVFSKVGKGWLGYMGHTTIEGMSQYIVKAMVNAPPLVV